MQGTFGGVFRKKWSRLPLVEKLLFDKSRLSQINARIDSDLVGVILNDDRLGQDGIYSLPRLSSQAIHVVYNWSQRIHGTNSIFLRCKVPEST